MRKGQIRLKRVLVVAAALAAVPLLQGGGAAWGSTDDPTVKLAANRYNTMSSRPMETDGAELTPSMSGTRSRFRVGRGNWEISITNAGEERVMRLTNNGGIENRSPFSSGGSETASSAVWAGGGLQIKIRAADGIGRAGQAVSDSVFPLSQQQCTGCLHLTLLAPTRSK